MIEDRRRNAIRFLKAIEESVFPDDLLTSDFSGWSGLSGDIPGPVMLERAVLLGEVFPQGMTFVVLDTVAEGQLVAVRASSTGTVFDGTPYRNDYHYLFRFGDDDRIERVWEYMNVQVAADIIRPAFAELARRKAQEKPA